MGKLSAGFDLATELRAQRRASRLTQAALAAKANLAERTVRALEQGSGTLDSWHAALRALGLRLSGRNLPAGETLGLRLSTLRRRRGLSQETLARSVGVTKPTLGALERDGKGRLSTLQRVLVVLGAGPYLRPARVPPPPSILTRGILRHTKRGRRRLSCSRPSRWSSSNLISILPPPGNRGATSAHA